MDNNEPSIGAEVRADKKSPRQKPVKPEKEKPTKPEKEEPSHKKKALFWGIKITVITFVLSVFFNYLSQITSSQASIVVAFILLAFLILLALVADVIAIATASCDLAPLLSMASRRVPGAKRAIKIVKNAEKVNNILSDVIGDICGIVSGACSLAIAIKFVNQTVNPGLALWVNVGFSSVVAAVTVGGKAFLKNFAMRNSKEIVMFVSRLITALSKDKSA